MVCRGRAIYKRPPCSVEVEQHRLKFSILQILKSQECKRFRQLLVRFLFLGLVGRRLLWKVLLGGEINHGGQAKHLKPLNSSLTQT